MIFDNLDKARKFIKENGVDAAQEEFGASLDKNLKVALFEEYNRQADTFNRRYREVMFPLDSTPAPPTPRPSH